MLRFYFCIFFFNDTSTTEIYTLSLHDALPIFLLAGLGGEFVRRFDFHNHFPHLARLEQDRKSTRLNSSHQIISYAVFCLKKKKHKSLTAIITEKTSPALHQPSYDVKSCSPSTV